MEVKRPSVFMSLIPFIFLVVSVYIGVFVYKTDIQILLLLSASVAAIVATSCGMKWEEIEKSIIDSIKISLPSILILAIIGIIIGTWILSGAVPTIIYYGLKILSPKYFLVTTALICTIISLATGSSWTTISTVGVALMGIGAGLGVPEEMIVGAIISGAFFGDKMSPLSDVTNIIPAVVETTLFEHIKHMLFTTVPALVISLVIYLIIGLENFSSGTVNTDSIHLILNSLDRSFYIHPVNLIPIVIVFTLVIKKMSPIPALFIGGVLGGVFSMMLQGAKLGEVIQTAHYGYISNTGVEIIDKLLSRGGYNSMFWVISLIIAAMCFGGIIESSGMLHVLSERIIRNVKSLGQLTVATLFTSFFVAFAVGNTYLSLILPGRMFKNEYENRNLAKKQLSRTISDIGTLAPPLIPWADSGAFIYATLGVSALKYIPYSYLCILTPIIAVIFGYTNRFIAYDVKISTRVTVIDVGLD
ncbi:MAG: Na+/H+ antiporter NhaC [Eubacteriales bacterium]|nr:Na+/H+ antiporter NhaC [Eubacteriales bacterium]